jgi:hypothetical protein
MLELLLELSIETKLGLSAGAKAFLSANTRSGKTKAAAAKLLALPA